MRETVSQEMDREWVWQHVRAAMARVIDPVVTAVCAACASGGHDDPLYTHAVRAGVIKCPCACHLSTEVLSTLLSAE